MSKTIVQLEDGYHGEITVLLLQVNKGVTAKGAPYLSFQFQDKTGNMDAKYWNVPENLLHEYHAGSVVKATGDVLCHQKQLQFRVNHLEILEEGSYELWDFVKMGPIEKDVLYNEIHAYADRIQNSKMKEITKAFLKQYEHDFFVYPAAMKNHHDFVSGLATHVLGMLHMADAVCNQYSLLNRDLMIAGVILHDIGKLIELSGAVVTEYTMQGKLLGHISIMQSMIEEKAIELDIDGEEITLLRHMVLSHHGKYEYGSPVLPMIPEAEMLYLIDNIDARMQTLEKAMNGVEVGSFTPRIFALENRSFYKHNLK